jgi:purine-binding chemotaxis protein CheW
MAVMARRAGRERAPAPDPDTLQRLMGAWADAPPGAARTAAAGAPAAVDTLPERPPLDGRLLRCDIGGGSYAFPLAAVAEVVPYSPPRRLPGQPADAGVTMLRGRVLPTVDAAARLGVAAQAPSGRVVVLESSSGDHAVAVTDTQDIVEIDPGRLSAPPPGAAASGFVAALADIDGEVVVVLDAERLCGG